MFRSRKTFPGRWLAILADRPDMLVFVGMAHVRRATEGDAEAIAELHLEAWQAAYSGQMPVEFLSQLRVGPRARMWRAVAGRAEEALFVCEGEHGALRGFGSLSPTREADAPPLMCELTALYVRPENWRCGTGRSLMAALITEASVRRFTEVVLWVLEGNRRARSFYEASQFVSDGTLKLDDRWGDFVLRELRYRRPLGPDS